MSSKKQRARQAQNLEKDQLLLQIEQLQATVNRLNLTNLSLQASNDNYKQSDERQMRQIRELEIANGRLTREVRRLLILEDALRADIDNLEKQVKQLKRKPEGVK